MYSNMVEEILKCWKLRVCLFENIQMASFVGPKTVVVNGVEYTADHINIAVGGRPTMPDVPGSEFCIDRREAFFCSTVSFV